MAAPMRTPSRMRFASPPAWLRRGSTKRSIRSWPRCPLPSKHSSPLSRQGREFIMGRLAFLFPGQGSQYSGMGRELAEVSPVARAVFDEADRALDFSVSELCFAGSEDKLKLTENTQPAILAASVASYRVLEEKGIRPDFVAGHSLGEYSALVAA